MLKKVKVSIFLFLFLFLLGSISVSAAESGVIGDYSYYETDNKTDYIKFELSNGNMMIFQFQSNSVGLINRMKDQFASSSFDGIPMVKSTNFFTVSNEKVLTYEVNQSRYSKPVFGDLVAFLESDESDASISSFQLYILPSEAMLPVFAHIVYGEEVLTSLTDGIVITSIRFIDYKEIKEEESGGNTRPGSNSNSGNSGGNSSSNNNSSGGEVHLIGGEDAGTTYCSDPNFIKPFKFLGRIFTILKILIPLIIIVFGIIDVAKAVIASKDDEIKKSTKSLAMRVIAGIVIFFIPTIINLVFYLVDDWNKYSTDYSNCSKCVMNPNKC